MIIYKTINLVNGKIYVGQDSKNDPAYLGSGNLLKDAIKKYGTDKFKKEILEYCNNKKELNEKEIKWIKKLNSTNKNIGYNISEGGTGGKLCQVEWKKGKTYEEAYGEEKAKIIKEKFSKTRKGKERCFVNITPEEVGKKISLSLTGIKRTEEYKNKVSESVKKFFETEEGKENRKKLRKLKTGVKQTEDSNKKRSQALKGKRPKQLEVHPSAKYWYFYNHNNELVLQSLGNMKDCFRKLEINHRHIKKFINLDECLSYCLEKNIKYKVFVKKYYEK